MLGRIRLHDYRCFWKEQPATLELHAGLTSFIGQNNSGKSTLIKAIHETRQAVGYLHHVGQTPTHAIRKWIPWDLPPSLYEQAEIITDREKPQCLIEIEPALPVGSEHKFIATAKVYFSADGKNFFIRIYSVDGRELGVPNSATEIKSILGGKITLASGESFEHSALLSFANSLASAQYFGAFRNAINEGAGQYFDNQIGTGFISQWHEWKTGPSKAKNRAIERVTEDICRLVGAKTLDISASNELKTLQIVIDKRPHKLRELGAGLSQLIVTLGNALIKKPPLILIDEPESHLHPSLQGEFLTTLASYAGEGVLFTTHSMGLARLADNCYTVQRNGERSVVRPFERTPNYAEFLGSLGIAGLMDLGWDRVLLVEGPKDVRTAQQLLRLYGKDRQTIVLPLGGDSMVNGNISHELSEVRRLCSHVFALVDSERDSADSSPIQARQKFAAICKGLNIKCCLTERRAIENYISQEMIDKTWNHEQYRALGHYDEPAKDGSFWGKGESWKAVRHLTRKEIEATDIGKFLASM